MQYENTLFVETHSDVFKKGGINTKTLATTVYLYPKEIEEVELNAKKLGLSKSAWIRRAILKSFKEALN